MTCIFSRLIHVLSYHWCVWLKGVCLSCCTCLVLYLYVCIVCPVSCIDVRHTTCEVATAAVSCNLV